MPKKINKKFIIIGAGPCGLGAAFQLQKLGCNDFLVLEKNDHVGGLAHTLIDSKNFRWDIGGHVIHSHYRYFDKVFASFFQKQSYQHLRQAWIKFLNNYVPYPFQKNLRYLPKEIIWECLAGLMELTKNSSKPSNFLEWLNGSFGSGIAQHYLIPDNFKRWAYPLKKMSFTWLDDRVAQLDFAEILQNIILEKDDNNWGPNRHFYFPKLGTGQIWQDLSKKIPARNLQLNSEVFKIDPKAKTLKTKAGQIYEYQQLISTIPLTQLVKKVKLKTKTTALHHSAIYIVGIGLKKPITPNLKQKSWIYFPNTKTPFFRATVFSNYSPKNVPNSRKYWSLMCEVSHSKYKAVDEKLVVKQVIAALVAESLIKNKSQIVDQFLHFEAFAYPTPTLNRDKILHLVLKTLEKKDIYSRGRFGAWKYEVGNMDHSFMQGVELANRLLKGKKEITVWQPGEVNSV